MLKKIQVLTLAMITLAAPALAGTVHIRADGRAHYLPSCGGVVRATPSGHAVSAQVRFSNVKNCSRVQNLTTGESDRLEGPNSDRYGSVQVRAYSHQIAVLTVRSVSGAHEDHIYVTLPHSGGGHGGGHGGNYARCYNAVKAAARVHSPFPCTSGAHADFLRISNNGNFVYAVTVTSCRGGRAVLEAVAQPGSCSVLSVQ